MSSLVVGPGWLETSLESESEDSLHPERKLAWDNRLHLRAAARLRRSPSPYYPRRALVHRANQLFLPGCEVGGKLADNGTLKAQYVVVELESAKRFQVRSPSY
eukprot:6214631-Pleurochrysis_carterae.AAC.5